LLARLHKSFLYKFTQSLKVTADNKNTADNQKHDKRASV